MKKIGTNKLLYKYKQCAGRNNQGRITVFHRGGGNKKLYRIIDFKRTLFNIPALVKKIEYDPNRTAKIALIAYKNGLLSYILAPKNLAVGDIISSGGTSAGNDNAESIDIITGNTLQIKNIPIGTIIHNIELKPGKGGQLMRAAGTYAKLIKKDMINTFGLIRLHTGKLYNISTESLATIGSVSNDNHKNIKYKKAGQSRWKNKRPTVRGMAMNPIDHPHGGGEGRSKGGGHPKSPWGKLTKGKGTSYLRLSTRRKKNC